MTASANGELALRDVDMQLACEWLPRRRQGLCHSLMAAEHVSLGHCVLVCSLLLSKVIPCICLQALCSRHHLKSTSSQDCPSLTCHTCCRQSWCSPVPVENIRSGSEAEVSITVQQYKWYCCTHMHSNQFTMYVAKSVQYLGVISVQKLQFTSRCLQRVPATAHDNFKHKDQGCRLLISLRHTATPQTSVAALEHHRDILNSPAFPQNCSGACSREVEAHFIADEIPIPISTFSQGLPEFKKPTFAQIMLAGGNGRVLVPHGHAH